MKSTTQFLSRNQTNFIKAVKCFKRVLRSLLSKINRKRVVKQHREKNRLKKCTVISSNCIGGILLHDLGLRFDSPTVNLWFDAEGYIKYLENFDSYINSVPDNFYTDKKHGYPIGFLDGDIKIRFQHYRTADEAKEKWIKRSGRIDRDNMFVICTDRDSMNEDLLRRFLKLPYKKIIYVSHKDMVLSDECIYVPGFEDKTQLPDMTGWADCSGHRYYEKYFDIVGWLNGCI